MVSQLPNETPVVHQGRWTLTATFVKWFGELLRDINRTAQRLAAAELTAQAATIASTAIFNAPSERLYRVTWYLRITQVASVSSSATVTIGWTHAGQAMTHTGAAVTGNLITTFQSGDLTVRADELTDITYQVAYASVGATPMQFSIDVTVEALP